MSKDDGFLRNFKPRYEGRWLAPDVAEELKRRGVLVTAEHVDDALRAENIRGGSSSDCIVVSFYADRYLEFQKMEEVKK